MKYRESSSQPSIAQMGGEKGRNELRPQLRRISSPETIYFGMRISSGKYL